MENNQNVDEQVQNNGRQNIAKTHRRVKFWSLEEDQYLQKLRKKYTNNWTLICKKIQEKFPNRMFTNKQCRERFCNHLEPGVQSKILFLESNWLPKEDAILIQKRSLKIRWCEISKIFLPNRTQHQIKNRYKWLHKNKINFVNQALQEIQQDKQSSEINQNTNIEPINQNFTSNNSIEEQNSVEVSQALDKHQDAEEESLLKVIKQETEQKSIIEESGNALLIHSEASKEINESLGVCQDEQSHIIKAQVEVKDEKIQMGEYPNQIYQQEMLQTQGNEYCKFQGLNFNPQINHVEQNSTFQHYNQNDYRHLSIPQSSYQQQAFHQFSNCNLAYQQQQQFQEVPLQFLQNAQLVQSREHPVNNSFQPLVYIPYIMHPSLYQQMLEKLSNWNPQ